MTRDEASRLHALLDRLTPDERLSCLVCHVMDRERGALRPLTGIVTVLSVLARGLSQRDAIALAEYLRDAADSIERRRERVAVE